MFAQGPVSRSLRKLIVIKFLFRPSLPSIHLNTYVDPYSIFKFLKFHSFPSDTAFAVVAVHGQRRFRNQQGRQGRQEPDAGYGAPQAEYGQPQADASSLSESHSGDHEGLDWLLESVPGTPGEDYPILAEVPETGFTCDGQVEGGKIYFMLS